MSKRYQVFVSSTYTDLIEERKEVTQAILKCNCFPAGMELFPASNKKQWEIIKKVIDDSDFYILIMAGRYGSLGLDDNGKKVGYTEMEFDYAVSTSKPIIVLLHDDPDSLPSKLVEKNESRRRRLDKFREKALTGRMVAFWNNKDQLHSAALNSLYQLKTNTSEAIGWVRADSIDTLDTIKENTDFSEDKVISTLEKINGIDEQLEFIASIDYNKQVELFNNKKFLKYYANFLNTKNTEFVIDTAITTIPDSYKVDYKSKEILINSSEIMTAFENLCNQFESEYFILCVELLNKLNYFKPKFAIPIFHKIKNDTEINNIIDVCLEYLTNFAQSWASTSESCIQIRGYSLTELKKPNRSVSTNALIGLFVSTCIQDDNDFVFIYDLYFDSNKETKEIIIDTLYEYYDSDALLLSPKTQREFFAICDDVFSWDNDEYTASLLLYCLFNRTYDVFTIDEIFEKLEKFNDDVFYIFMWRLHYEEFGYGKSEYYRLDEAEKNRIKDIINARNHPRKEKLLELF